MSPETVHKLGVALCLVAGLWSLSWVLGAARRERRVRGRLRAVLVVEPKPAGRRFDVRAPIRMWLPVVGAVSACWVFVGGVPGIVVGLVAGFGVRRLQRRPTPTEQSDSELAEQQLPLAADLLAACIVAVTAVLVAVLAPSPSRGRAATAVPAEVPGEAPAETPAGLPAEEKAPVPVP